MGVWAKPTTAPSHLWLPRKTPRPQPFPLGPLGDARELLTSCQQKSEDLGFSGPSPLLAPSPRILQTGKNGKRLELSTNISSRKSSLFPLRTPPPLALEAVGLGVLVGDSVLSRLGSEASQGPHRLWGTG
uniref:Uncharacterized protein n=1 Tax=Pipistrellus kuhlii TaxID=59472 RepID=A0A7J7UA24_PIPKU|nr:hypothetical protein mPipKuh1_009128 [Pipistrellus kuhlii]